MYMFKLRFLAPQCYHLPTERLRVVDGASAVLLLKDLELFSMSSSDSQLWKLIYRKKQSKSRRAALWR